MKRCLFCSLQPKIDGFQYWTSQFNFAIPFILCRLSLLTKISLNKNMEWLKISTSTELVRVLSDDIVFVAADGNYSDMYLFDGKPYKMTFQLHYFDEVFKTLQDNIFVRVGKSLIVNRKYIYIINLTSQELRLNGQNLRSEFRLKASKEALKDLKTRIESKEDTNEKKGDRQ